MLSILVTYIMNEMIGGNAHTVFRSPINMDAVQSAAKILNGIHDFRAFTNPSSLTRQTWINPVKAVKVSIEPGLGFLTQYTKNDHFDYWNFVFNSHSFLYKQVSIIEISDIS